MTHITIQIPARSTRAPRGAEPLARIAWAASGLVHRLGAAVLSGLRSRHLLARGAGHVPQAATPCVHGIGKNKG